jgi:hypothetical protein
LVNGRYLIPDTSHMAHIQTTGTGTHIVTAVFIFGVFLRLGSFAVNWPLSGDEEALIQNIEERSPTDLLSPLDHDQVAPPGFLLLEKTVIAILGRSAYALRLWPLVCGIASLFLFWIVARRILDGWGPLIAVAMFAMAPLLVKYSAEVKQYGSDVAWAALLLLLVSSLLIRESPDPSLAGFWGLVGAIAVWFSHPAVFVLAGSAFVVAGDSIIRRDLRWKSVAAAGMIWIASFGLLYFGVLRPSIEATSPGLFENWMPGFMPLPPRSSHEIAWFYHSLTSHLTYTMGLTGPVKLAIVGVAVAGMVRMYRHFPSALALTISPVIFALIASGLQLYPFIGRVAVYTMPLMFLIFAAGVESVRVALGVWSTSASMFAVVALTLVPSFAPESGEHGSFDLGAALRFLLHLW